MVKPIEGDVAVLRDGSIWVVKGCVHPRGYFVGVPRLIPSHYLLKLKRLRDSLSVVTRYYRHYLSYVGEVGYEVPKVPLSHVIKYITWRDPKVITYLPKNELGGNCLELIRLISRHCRTYCGPTGSLLGGYFGPYSDIDIACFDTPNIIRCLRRLRDAGLLKPLSTKEFITELSEVSEVLSVTTHCSLVRHKVLQGVFNGFRYTLRVINCLRIRGVLGPYEHVLRPKLVVCRVMDSDYRTPSVYNAELIKAVNLEYVSTYDSVRLITHRIRFTELPKDSLLIIKSPLVFIKGRYLIINLDTSDYVDVVIE